MHVAFSTSGTLPAVSMAPFVYATGLVMALGPTEKVCEPIVRCQWWLCRSILMIRRATGRFNIEV
jgi:hypothetical protein